MADPLVTLTSDFGGTSPYVAAMKGALLTVNPAAKLVDLSHRLPPQDLRFASFFLRSAIPYYPEGTLHVVVVDPGVGTERAVLYLESGGQRLLVPDNGCWTALAARSRQPPRVIRVSERRYWRSEVSATFHGRDIFAPVAGHLSLGLRPEELGPVADSWIKLPWPEPAITPRAIEGEVLVIDDFGNLITNIPGEAYFQNLHRVRKITVGGSPVDRQVRTYGESAPGTLVALVSSAAMFEVAVVEGNAARRLGAAAGTPVRIELDNPPAAGGQS
jgi:S-adenosylmethionine hydrolase